MLLDDFQRWGAQVPTAKMIKKLVSDDSGKNIKEHKCFTLIDTLGLLLTGRVTVVEYLASKDDRVAVGISPRSAN